VAPEILLIPLVGFDRQLNRLGYGGGFYDRYISKIKKNKKIIKIGLGFSFQKIDKLPINKHDKKLDYILTEKSFTK
jgi:5-formyltetrahydrofolate cyclo-ligase